MEPVAQRARLNDDGAELARARRNADAFQHRRLDQVGLRQPIERSLG